MVKLVTALAAVFFCISPLISNSESRTATEAVLSEMAGFCNLRTADYTQDLSLEALSRCVSLESFNSSLDAMVAMVKGLVERYPQFKFAFCVTHAGDVVVFDETRITYCEDDLFPVNIYRGVPARQNLAPVTAFHIASMGAGTGYHELPRPEPVVTPLVVQDVSSAKPSVPQPVSSRISVRPNGIWRALPGDPAQYVLLLSFPKVLVSEN